MDWKDLDTFIMTGTQLEGSSNVAQISFTEWQFHNLCYQNLENVRIYKSFRKQVVKPSISQIEQTLDNVIQQFENQL